METKIYNINNAVDLSSVLEIVNSGQPLIFPTETVFGIGADIYNLSACKMIYKIKSRDMGKPLSAHVCSIEMALKLISQPSDLFFSLAEKFLPGPLAIIMKKNNSVSKEISSGLDSISIRFPDNKECIDLIKAINKPLAATSANISGEKALTNSKEIMKQFNGQVSAVIDGSCKYNTESTIISLVDKPIILRQGVISKEEIQDNLSMFF
jgi:L-threonylcarbamoyladenylate synthase